MFGQVGKTFSAGWRKLLGTEDNSTNPATGITVEAEFDDAMRRAGEILILQGYQRTNNSMACQAYGSSLVFLGGKTDCAVVNASRTYFQSIEDGAAVHLVLLATMGEKRLSEAVAVGIRIPNEMLESEALPVRKFPEVSLKQFLDTIGREPAAEFFAGIERNAPTARAGNPAPAA
jgi:hypothetical protein